MSIEIVFTSDSRADEWESPVQFDTEEFVASAYALGNYGTVWVWECQAFPFIEKMSPEEAQEALEAFDKLGHWVDREQALDVLYNLRNGHRWDAEQISELLEQWDDRVTHWDSFEDYARYWMDATGEGLPEFAERHFDFESYGEELVDAAEANGDAKVQGLWGAFTLIRSEA